MKLRPKLLNDSGKGEEGAGEEDQEGAADKRATGTKFQRQRRAGPTGETRVRDS